MNISFLWSVDLLVHYICIRHTNNLSRQACDMLPFVEKGMNDEEKEGANFSGLS